MIPVFVPVRDRVAPLRRLVAWFEQIGGAELWLLDNQSTYPPLVDYLEASPHHVVPLHRNLWNVAPWLSGLVYEVAHDRHFIVSDPDTVPDESCPSDVFDHLVELLDRYPEVVKAGLGLRIDDLPAHYAHRDDVIAWESQFWTDELEPGVLAADVDTTFAMYRANSHYSIGPALRTAAPYVVQHLPWYEDSSAPTPEIEFYRLHADPLVSNWDRVQLPAWKRYATR
jgi:hypothetical protein